MPEGYSYTGGIEDLPGTGTQKNLHMIFVIDDSGSMQNAHRMDAVNAALQKMVPELQKIQQKVQGDFTIYLSIMTFDEDPQWVVEPTEIAYYVHSPIEASKYVTYYSRAFEELNRKLSRSAFMNQSGKMAAPYIMLFLSAMVAQTVISRNFLHHPLWRQRSGNMSRLPGTVRM